MTRLCLVDILKVELNHRACTLNLGPFISTRKPAGCLNFEATRCVRDGNLLWRIACILKVNVAQRGR